MHGTEFKIVDPETNNVLPPGSKGIVKVRGPQVMKGYYKVVFEFINSLQSLCYYQVLKTKLGFLTFRFINSLSINYVLCDLIKWVFFFTHISVGTCFRIRQPQNKF